MIIHHNFHCQINERNMNELKELCTKLIPDIDFELVPEDKFCDGFFNLPSLSLTVNACDGKFKNKHGQECSGRFFFVQQVETKYSWDNPPEDMEKEIGVAETLEEVARIILVYAANNYIDIFVENKEMDQLYQEMEDGKAAAQEPL